MKNKNQKGFTLLEILLVVAAIAILAGIVIVAINPNKQLGDTRNAQRQSNVSTILDAVYQYSVDNNGVLPASITTSSKTICSTTGADCVTGGFADLGVLIDLQKYITSVPIDPKCAVAVTIRSSIDGHMFDTSRLANRDDNFQSRIRSA